jgi:hypothetical protein
MKFRYRKTVLISAVVCAAFFFAADAGAVTLQAASYKELHGHLKTVNSDGSPYKDEDVLIELTADLDVNDMGSALGAPTDEDTGATLTISRSDVAVDGQNHTIASRGYPAFHVEGKRGEEPALEGIEIRNVTVDGAGYQRKMGGGMFFENKARVTLKNSTIKNGSAKLGGGGAFYAGPHGSPFGPEITVENCVFENNTAASGAGGAILGYYAKLNISGSTFDGNKAPLGGAIALYGNGARLAVSGGSVFKNNEAAHSGGAVHVFYGFHRAASRGTPVVATTDIDAGVTAAFEDNAAGVPGTENCVLGVARDPAASSEEADPDPAGKLRVNGSPVPATLFADPERTRLATPR